jgi:hypothetical protein
LGFLKSLFGSANFQGKEDDRMPKLPIEMVRVRGEDALAERERLSTADVSAIILGSYEDTQTMQDVLSEATLSPDELASRGLEIDVAKWVAQQTKANADFLYEAGQWPKGPARAQGLSLHLDVLTKKPKPSVFIGLFPTPDAWKAPAYVHQGGWNENPDADLHVALHKRWAQKYGSRLVCMSSDVMECTVEHPPSTRAAALELAREHFFYCQDIVHQGTESIEGLAALLLDGGTWYFWWD